MRRHPAYAPSYGDTTDNENHRIVTSLSTICDEIARPVWAPGAIYCSSALARFINDGMIEISRDGKGDKLIIDIGRARNEMLAKFGKSVHTTMAPVRHAATGRTVAFVCLSDDDGYYISTGLTWTRGEHTEIIYCEDEASVFIRLAAAYII